jgi:hypothetical protein
MPERSGGGFIGLMKGSRAVDTPSLRRPALFALPIPLPPKVRRNSTQQSRNAKLRSGVVGADAALYEIYRVSTVT